MKPLLFILSFALALWSPAALAQGRATAAEPAPKGPLPGRAPEFASWTVTYEYRSAKESDPQAGAAQQPEIERIRQVTVTKTGKTYREETRLTTGRKSEKWIFDGVQLMMPPGSTSIVAIPSPEGEDFPSPDFSDYGSGDFPEVAWVSPDHYQGRELYRGQPVYRFEARGKIALLSVETRRPLFASEGNASLVFTENPPPAAPLVPPRHFLAVLETHKRGLNLLRRHPSRP